MKIKSKYIAAVLVTFSALLTLQGCKEDFLENELKSNLTDQTQWAGETNADLVVSDIYSNLPNLHNRAENLDNFTDDNDGGTYYGSWNFKQGIVDASSTNYDIWGSTSGPADIHRHNWTTYRIIRKCNNFLEGAEKNKANFSEAWYKRRVDEVRFLRAYYYSILFEHLGGLPIITATQNRSQDSTEIYKPRSTYEETYKFITKELGEVVANGNLPVKYNAGEANSGRATLGAALALKGWVELYAASPAFNAPEPASGPDPKKVAGFGNYEVSRWATAAATFKSFIDMWGNGIPYKLFDNTATLWYEANKYNSEVIFDRQSVVNTSGGGENLGSAFEQYGGPVWVLGNYYTWGNYNPTQELVDEFRMANGKKIYKIVGGVKTYDPTSGYDEQNPYVNREKRFYDWIVYDGAPYKMDWMPTADVIYTRIDKVNPSKNEIDFGTGDVGNTGYYFKKRLNPLTKPNGGNISAQNYIYMRYADVLLGYAEAQNEALPQPDASVYDAINKIRLRSNLPELQTGLNKDDMRIAIRNERRVELCFEGKRFYDIIRWKIAEDVMNKDLHGMKITNTVPANNSGVWKYEVIGLNHPHVFHKKMYLNPIPQPVIAQNPKLTQNPGYPQ